ncbi:MAG: hypothetical protein PHF37_03710 [Phycisphaerae bacterium]|nr:hypothetical protein [Phycisphaerae bacterium]
MNEFYKHPLFYFIAVPIVLILWPLLLWTVYLPRVQTDFKKQIEQYEKALPVMTEILSVDSDRLDFAGKDASVDFDYATAINKVAQSCQIPEAGYKLNAGLVISSGGQKSQTANLDLQDIDIERFANFISTMQVRWSNLQCTKLNLRKVKGTKNTWDVDIQMKYYF